MTYPEWLTTIIFVLDWVVRLGLSLRVVMRRLPVGTALAWLSILLIFPLGGGVLYLLFGEYRLGRRWKRRTEALRQSAAAPLAALRAARPDLRAALDAADRPLALLAESTLEAPTLTGNHLELLGGAEAVFPRLIAEVEAATASLDLLFYIWFPGGQADELAEAVMRAARRGVQCRVLVDAVGSSAWLRSAWPRRLREGGVQVESALPAGVLRLLVTRPDLRMHRKIAVIDNAAAYTGSMNVADPRYFKRTRGVGPWVDAMVRVRGPAVFELALTFLQDWAVQTGEEVTWPQPAVRDGLERAGAAAVQVLATGPLGNVEAIERIVLMAIYEAQREVVLTTPYFIPSESMLSALVSAARRGVAVTLIVPRRVDSRLVHFASRSHQADLLAAGVRVALFREGLLHTKSITVDGRQSLFGSLNLDPRSMRLDFEITLAISDAAFTGELRALQESYLAGSDDLSLKDCQARGIWEKLAENTTRLLGPVL